MRVLAFRLAILTGAAICPLLAHASDAPIVIRSPMRPVAPGPAAAAPQPVRGITPPIVIRSAPVSVLPPTATQPAAAEKTHAKPQAEAAKRPSAERVKTVKASLTDTDSKSKAERRPEKEEPEAKR